MANDVPGPSVEVGRIVFRSWEHEWETGYREADSVASARRTLPSDVTQPIYEILERWERDLLRSSLPFSPYGLRIRPPNTNCWTFVDTDYAFAETARRVSPVGELCPKWDESLPQPQEKRTKFGAVLRAPLSDTQVNSVYQVIWRPATFPETVNIDKLLRQFSPRNREPPIFASRLLIGTPRGNRGAPG
jgi:hypothetical protein